TTKLIQVLSSTVMATTRIPDLTTTIMLSDSSTTSREEIQKAEQASKGPIVGGIVGSIAFVAIFVVLAVFFKRVHIMKQKTNGQSECMVGSLKRQSSLKDYTGIQMVAYPGEGDKHLTRDISDNSQNRYVSDQKESFKRKERKIDSAKCAGEYTLAKPIPNKLQSSNIQLEITTSDCGYSMAKRISKEDKDGENCIQSNSDFVASNDYQDSTEGVYDQAKTRRNMNDVDVYARATDGTYDTANHCTKRRTENDDIAYDHFTGPKTNDNYDLVITHNQVVGDDTYGVN
ncbi:Hypothetical predicted protein, partial [Mytilus galloprovincialis]